jgi:hypothetical protein
MIYKIDNFIVVTKEKIVETREKIIAPVDIDVGSRKKLIYAKVNKTKNINIFAGLGQKGDNRFLIDDLFLFIDFIEVLKAFANNKLNTDKEYNFNDKFTAKVVSKNKIFYLKIRFKKLSFDLFYDKFEATSLSAKFSKILSRCEAWQELEA